MKRQSLNRSAFIVLLVLLLGACSTKTPVVEAPPEGLFHTVTHRGETLGVVSAWFTGNSANWRKIQHANPELNPNRIDIGDTLFIPKSLLVRENELPLHFVRKYLQKFREKKFINSQSQSPQLGKFVEEESIGPEEEPIGGEREELLSDLLM